MNLIKSIILFIKKLFNKQSNVKEIEAPKKPINNDTRNDFINSLRVNNISRANNKQIETLVFTGNGLGIQKKIEY